jgi:HK97 family phage major capsid protein
MLGILKETRIAAANKITLTAAEFGSWSEWKKKVFAKMKKSYRNGAFIMAQGTFDGYIDGMVDDNGQPIARINYGIDGGETYRFGGRNVETVEDEILPAYEDAANGDVVAVFMRLDDYAVNTNMQMRIVHWIDHDDNQLKNKAIVILDGKVLDPHGILLIIKGN